jgi:hypothetical protein
MSELVFPLFIRYISKSNLRIKFYNGRHLVTSHYSKL